MATPAFSSREIALQSLAVPPSAESRAGRSKDEIANELSSGKVMEGGAVIDFSAIKGESRAEAALAAAREQLILADIGGKTKTNLATTEILGINQDVIAEVGHDLGQFADAETVQKVAAYLRSNAPAGFFRDRQGYGSPHDQQIGIFSIAKYRQEGLRRVWGSDKRLRQDILHGNSADARESTRSDLGYLCLVSTYR